MPPKGSILIVDNDPGVRESLHIILKPFYKIYTASNGREAVACVKNNEIDLITMDLKMPGFSGFETLREVQKIDEEIGIIIITALASMENAKKIWLHDVKAFIPKPLDIIEVFSIIREFFENRSDLLMAKNLLQEIDRISQKNSILPF